MMRMTWCKELAGLMAAAAILAGTTATAGVIAVYRFDEADTAGPAVDSSGNGLNGVYEGGVALGPGKFGQAALFDGASSSVSIAGNPRLNVTDLSLEFWIKLDGANPSYHMPIARGLNNPWTVQVNPVPNLGDPRTLRWIVPGGGVDAINAIAPDVWQHVAIVQQGKTAQLYVDGTLVGGGNNAGLPVLELPGILLGKRGDGHLLQGMLDEVALFKQKLTPEQILAHSTAPIAPGPQAPGLIAWWRFEEANATQAAADSSGNGLQGAYRGGASLAAGKFGQGLQLDGSSGYVWVQGHTAFDSTTLTLEFWINITDTDFNTYSMPVTRDLDNGQWNGNKPWVVQVNPAGDASAARTLRWISNGDGSGMDAADALSPNAWHHVAITMEGDTAELYVDGVMLNSGNTTPLPNPAGEPVLIGRRTDGYHLLGALDDVALFDVALAPNQIRDHMNNGASANLVPPVVELAITQQPGDLATGIGKTDATVGLAAFALGGDPTQITYQWQKNGVNIEGATQSSYTLPAVVGADEGTKYRCLVSYPGLPGITSAEATVRINWALGTPAFSNRPLFGGRSPARLTDGDEAGAGGQILHGEATIEPGFAYEVNLQTTVKIQEIVIWARQDGCCGERLSNYRVSVHKDNNGVIGDAVWTADLRTDGSNPGSFPGAKDVVRVDLDPAGKFEGQWIRILSLDDPVPSYALQMTEIEVFGSLPPELKLLITKQPESVLGRPWGRASFSVEARILNGDASQIGYQWQRNGVNVPGATRATYVKIPLTAEDHGALYRCVASYPGVPSLPSEEAMVSVDWAFGAPAFANGPLFAGRSPLRLTDGDVAGLGGQIIHGDAVLEPGFAYEVNLQRTVKIQEIVIWARQDGCCPERLSKYRLSVHKDNNGVIGDAVWTADLHADGSDAGSFPGAKDVVTADLNPAGNFEGQWIRLQSLDDPVPSYALQMNEIVVFGTSESAPPARLNLALSAPVTSNRPLYAGRSPALLTDGDILAAGGNIIHGEASIAPGFAYEIDLEAAVTIEEIVIWPRQDGCCPERLTKYRVTVHRDNQGTIGDIVWSGDMHADGSDPGSLQGSKDVVRPDLDPQGKFEGQWIRIQSLEDPVRSYALQMTEVEVYGRLAAGEKPTISLTRSPAGLILEWSAGAALQEANNVTGLWEDVPGATSPRPIQATSGMKFYRARQ